VFGGCKGEFSMSEEVTAPIAGKVWKILVKVGDQVQYEDELMILEAMKMENPIYAPTDGKVAEIKVSEGDQVEPNQALIIIS
jgi:acetyl-CoA carboxylase biotin carboxyl carrier protein